MLFGKKHVTADDFDVLVRPHIASLYRLAYHFTGNQDDAEDLVQDLLVKSYIRRTELAAINDLRTWLAKVLYRMFVDQWRRLSGSPIKDWDVVETRGDPIHDVACTMPGPEQQLEMAQGNGPLLAALSSLDEEYRILLVMHDVEGYTLPELHAVTDLPVGTLKSRLHRARQKLKGLLMRDRPFITATAKEEA